MESTKLKAQAARRWCENAAALTGKKWIYAKVTESLFDQHRGYDFETLMQAAE